MNLVDRSKLPDAPPPPDFTPPAPEIVKLSNGMRVWYLKQGPTPLVAVLLVLPNGAAADPVGKEGLTALTADMLDEGAGGKSALEISDRLRNLAVDHSSEVELDATTLVLHLIAENYEPGLELLADFVLRPSFPADELARRKEQRIARALAAEAEPDEVRALVLRRVLFGDGYGGELARGTRASLKGLTLEDVKAHYQRVIQPEGADLVVVGGIEKDRAVAGLEAAFGKWRGKPTAKRRALVPTAPQAGVHLAHFEGASQSQLAIVRRADGAASPDYFRAMVFNRSFGGAFTSRVNMNLREDKGYTYGARSTFQRYRETGYFGVLAAVKSEDTRASIDETLKELREVCGPRPLTDKEREESVNGLLLGFPGRFQTVGNLAAQVASLPIYDRNPEWLRTWSENVEKVTTADANDVARRYCDPKDFVVVMSADRTKVGPTLEGLGVPVFEYDKLGKLVTPKK
jgi:zinc protease